MSIFAGGWREDRVFNAKTTRSGDELTTASTSIEDAKMLESSPPDFALSAGALFELPPEIRFMKEKPFLGFEFVLVVITELYDITEEFPIGDMGLEDSPDRLFELVFLIERPEEE